jgi:thioredoxin reductase
MQKRLVENPKIEIHFQTNIVKYTGKDFLEGLVLQNTKTGQVKKRFYKSMYSQILS